VRLVRDWELGYAADRGLGMRQGRGTQNETGNKARLMDWDIFVIWFSRESFT